MSTAACQAEPAPISTEDSRSPLHLERKIALPGVKGRIDHLAFDPVHDLVFVAEYGNGTVDAVDLAAGRVVGRIAGLHEPQGIGVSADGEQIVVACGDGTVHFYPSFPVAEANDGFCGLQSCFAPSLAWSRPSARIMRPIWRRG